MKRQGLDKSTDSSSIVFLFPMFCVSPLWRTVHMGGVLTTMWVFINTIRIKQICLIMHKTSPHSTAGAVLSSQPASQRRSKTFYEENITKEEEFHSQWKWCSGDAWIPLKAIHWACGRFRSVIEEEKVLWADFSKGSDWNGQGLERGSRGNCGSSWMLLWTFMIMRQKVMIKWRMIYYTMLQCFPEKLYLCHI